MFVPCIRRSAVVWLSTGVLALLATLAVDSRGWSQDSAFPLQGLMPKQETNATDFLQRHPDDDGRGVVVAVFDTGVDPGAEGLQTTSDGKPKIVDVVDASGSGDVDTSVVRQATDGVLEGLSGRKLQVPAQWQNPSGKFHLGIKAGYELFPRSLLPRLKEKRLERWLERQRTLVNRLRQQIADWDARYPDPTPAQNRQREELTTRLEVLDQLQETYDDPGPLFDCVVFHDGQVWRAAVDTDEDGRLDDEKLLTDYHRERQYATFGREDLLNFAVNIYDQGRLLSIVADSGAHGTHVAGIIAGYYPKQPELNGIAPGAQIVSVKIGDTRVGTRSLGTGSVRGLIAALRNRCDLINMSYGGPTPEPNRGRINELYQEIVDRHGVIFVASAGNSGPALTTVGSPGGTTSAILGVGAAVSPALMESAYSLSVSRPEEPFTWSSRGPTADGDLGVDITAPGGAFSPVPHWVLQRNMLMNGTSMSSPNACGGIALLLAALKQRKSFYTPYAIHAAVRNTARPIEGSDVWSQGAGMLQVDRALEYLERFPVSRRDPLRYEVRLPQLAAARGIYLREAAESNRPLRTEVQVDPVFHHDTKNEFKVQFNRRLAIRCDADWVEVPPYLLLPHGGRSFTVRVDPTHLPPGLHAAEIQGRDADAPEGGPLWRLPITVIRPETLATGGDTDWSERLVMQPGQIERRFVSIPQDATWVDVTLRAGGFDTPRRVVLHAVQLLPQREFSETSRRDYITLTPGEQVVRSLPVTGGRTLELCLAQYWSNPGEADLELSLVCRGLNPAGSPIELTGGQRASRVELTGGPRDQRIAPQAQLTTLRTRLLPTESRLRPLDGPRDQLPRARQIHELVLSYNFHLERETQLTPRPALDLLPQSGMELESGLWMVFDKNKQLLATGSSDDSVKLKKGDYVLRLQLRHDAADVLEPLKSSALLLDQELTPPLSLAVYDSGIEAFRQGRKMSPRRLAAGERTVLYVAPPDEKQWPPQATAGDLLLGRIQFGEANAALPGEGRRPGGFPLLLPVPQRGAGSSTPQAATDSGSSVAERSADQRKPAEKRAGNRPEESGAKADDAWRKSLRKRILDAQLAELAALRKAGNKEAFEQLAKQLEAEQREAEQREAEQREAEQREAGTADPQPILLERLKLLDDADRKPHLPEIVQLIDTLLARIDQEALARGLALRVDDDDQDAVRERKRLEDQKTLLVDLLYRKGRALAYMDLPPKFGVPAPDPDPVRRHPEDRKQRDKLFEETFARLSQWVDTTDDRFILLHIRHERRNNRRGKALQTLNQLIEKQPERELLYSKRIDLLHELKWNHWRDQQVQWLKRRFPAAYPPF